MSQAIWGMGLVPTSYCPENGEAFAGLDDQAVMLR